MSGSCWATASAAVKDLGCPLAVRIGVLGLKLRGLESFPKPLIQQYTTFLFWPTPREAHFGSPPIEVDSEETIFRLSFCRG